MQGLRLGIFPIAASVQFDGGMKEIPIAFRTIEDAVSHKAEPALPVFVNILGRPVQIPPYFFRLVCLVRNAAGTRPTPAIEGIVIQ